MSWRCLWRCSGRFRRASSDLAKQSVQLDGLYVVLKQPQPGERRLVGRIKSVNQSNVELDETVDGRTSIAADLVRLEGSKFSFKRCLSRLLGTRYRDFEAQRDIWEAKFTSGPSFKEVLGKFSRNSRTVNLGPGIVPLSAPPFRSRTPRERQSIGSFLQSSIVSTPRRRSERRFHGMAWSSSARTTAIHSKSGRHASWSLCPSRSRTRQSRCLARSSMVCGTGNTRSVSPACSICPVADQRLAPNQHAAAYRAAIESHLSSGASL